MLATPEATSERTASPTRSTPSPTPTATLGAIGGRDFTLLGGPPRMTWAPGTDQTGYLLVRWSPAGGATVFLPPPNTPLPPTATSFTDPTTLGNALFCYVVIPMNGPDVLAVSDLLCLIPNTANAAGLNTNLTVRLSQSPVASLSWSPAAGYDGYRITAFTFDGAPPRQLPALDASADSLEDDTGGIATCYLLSVMSGVAAVGNGHVMCAVPGVASGLNQSPPADPNEAPPPAPTLDPEQVLLPDTLPEGLVEFTGPTVPEEPNSSPDVADN